MTPSASSPTILVAENNPITRKMIRFALEGEGYAVLEADTGEAALQIAAGQRTDLVLQDHVLPDMDGLRLLSEIRKLPGRASVPVLILTGMVSRIEELRSHADDATVFLAKPLETSRLVEIVRTHRAWRPEAVGRGRRVLVVDDERLNQKLAALSLRAAGFEVETASGAEEALELARRSPPEAILSDVLMPGTDGFLLCRAVRADARLSRVPVVLVSSEYVAEQDRSFGREMGANAFVLRTPDLGEAISALVESLGGGAVPASQARNEDLDVRHRERIQVQLDRQITRNQALLREAAIQAAALSVARGLRESLAQPRDVRGVIGDVLVDCLDAAGLSTGVLYLVEENGLSLRAVTGLAARSRLAAKECFGHPEVLRRIVVSGEPVAFVAGGSDDAGGEIASRLGHSSVLIVPFVVLGEPLAALLLASDSHDLSERSWIGFAGVLAEQFGQAIAFGQAAVRLAASEERYRALMEQANDAILLLDQGRRIVEANRQAESLLGSPRGQLVGRCYDDFVVPEEREDAAAERRRLSSSGTLRIEECHLLKPDGTRVTVEISGSLIHVGGQPVVLEVLRDVTERRRLEDQLRQAATWEAIGRLAGGVAHDFNNMLAVIVGYSDLLLKDVAEPRMRLRLDEIHKAADRATALTQQLLAYSRRQVLQPKVLDLNEVVRDIEMMLQRLIGEDIQFTTVFEAALGRVTADPGQVEQIIVNLAVNARDAMPRGGKLIIETSNATLDEDYCRTHEGARPGAYVMLAVSDTGHGMDAATMAHIFEPFFTTKEVGRGTGLGLATVYGIAKQSGGRIDVSSEPGGTTFKIYLPRLEAEWLGPGEKPVPPPPPPLGSEAILLVEDNEALRAMIHETLDGAGYTVVAGSNPREALGSADSRTAPIHLLLTDVVMPGMSGRELAEILEASRPGLRVVYMSGYTDEAISHHGVLNPGTRFLQKPFSAGALLRTVRQALDADR